MPQKKQSKQSELIRVIEYFISGGAYFWTGYAVFALCDKAFGLNLWWAKLIANIVGWIVNYLLQRYWVFNNKKLQDHQTQVTGRYVGITLFDFVLDYLIVATLQSMGLTPYIGQFVSSGFFTVWNYFWYRLWVFPDTFKRLPKRKTTVLKVVAHRPHGPSSFRGSKV